MINQTTYAAMCHAAQQSKPRTSRLGILIGSSLAAFTFSSCGQKNQTTQNQVDTPTTVESSNITKNEKATEPKLFSVELTPVVYSDRIVKSLIGDLPKNEIDFSKLSESDLAQTLAKADKAIDDIEEKITKIEERYPVDLNGSSMMPYSLRTEYRKLYSKLLLQYDIRVDSLNAQYDYKLKKPLDHLSTPKLKKLVRKLAEDHEWAPKCKGTDFGTIRVCKGELNDPPCQRAAYRLRKYDNEARYLEKRIKQIVDLINDREAAPKAVTESTSNKSTI